MPVAVFFVVFFAGAFLAVVFLTAVFFAAALLFGLSPWMSTSPPSPGDSHAFCTNSSEATISYDKASAEHRRGELADLKCTSIEAASTKRTAACAPNAPGDARPLAPEEEASAPGGALGHRGPLALPASERAAASRTRCVEIRDLPVFAQTPAAPG